MTSRTFNVVTACSMVTILAWWRPMFWMVAIAPLRQYHGCDVVEK